MFRSGLRAIWTPGRRSAGATSLITDKTGEKVPQMLLMSLTELRAECERIGVAYQLGWQKPQLWEVLSVPSEVSRKAARHCPGAKQ
jgi:hypothetical protein